MYFSTLDVGMIMLAFYIAYLWVLPRNFRQKNIWTLVLCSASLVVALAGGFSWLMWMSLQHNLIPIRFEFSWSYAHLQQNRFFIVLVGMLGACFVKLVADRLEVRKRMEIMEKEKSIAELNYLKAQINPHFLFNTLNSLYAQLEIGSDAAKGTLSSIADLLRYQLHECNADFIPVRKELDYIKNFFNLQSLRKDNCITDLVIAESPEDLVIAPFMLITFIENAFKYVSDHEDKENFVKTTISFDSGKIIFRCLNTLGKPDLSLSTAGGKGIGLVNVQKRLELIYKGKYYLHSEMMEGKYEVSLTIDLK